MQYDLARLDSDPTYAPGLKRSKGHSYWAPPRKYVEAGYKARNVKLNGNPDEIAAKCRELTRELLLWWDGTPKVQLESLYRTA